MQTTVKPTRVRDLMAPVPALRRRRTSRTAAVAVALRLIDERGIEACSMRTVAQELGVSSRALYRHVSDKDDLLRAVANEILSDIRLPRAHGPGPQRVRAVVWELRRVLMDHPHAVRIFAARATAAPPAVVPVTDAVVGGLRAGGLDAEQAVRTFFAIFNYTLGFALAAAPSAGNGGDFGEAFSGVDPSLVPDAAQVAPFLRRFTADGLSASDEQFAFGLDLLMSAVTEGPP